MKRPDPGFVFVTPLQGEECPSGKDPFTYRRAQEALRQARRARRSGRQYRMERSAYPCDLCPWWHLTSQARGHRVGRRAS